MNVEPTESTIEGVDAARLFAYRWTRSALPDLVDANGHPCMWAVAAALAIVRRGDRVTAPAVRALRDELMPDEYRDALAELSGETVPGRPQSRRERAAGGMAGVVARLRP